MWSALSWKAWRENRLAGGACLLWMGFCVAYLFAYEGIHRFRAPVAGFFGCAMLYQCFAATCFAVLTTQRERSNQTLAFTRALPVSLPRVAAFRLAAAMAAIIIPILLLAVVLGLGLATGLIEQAAERADALHVRLTERPSMTGIAAVEFLLRTAAIVMASAAQLLLVMCILGNLVRSEKTVGFLGVVLSFAWILSGPVGRSTSGWPGMAMPSTMAVKAAYGYKYGGYGDLLLATPVWKPLALHLVVLGLLAAWFVRGYGRLPATPTEKKAWINPRLTIGWLRRFFPQFHSPLGSLVWLTLRESIPLALSGLALAMLMAIVEFGSEGHPQQDAAAAVAVGLGKMVWAGGMAWAVVVAAGVFAAELQPRLARFWSARPISPLQWFFVKYIMGLIAVVLVLDGTAIVSGWLVAPLGEHPNVIYRDGMSWSYVFSMPLIHAVTYSLGVACVVATGSGVFGASAALGVFAGYIVLLDFFPPSILRDPVEVYNGLLTDELKGQLNLWAHGYPVVAAMSLVLIAAALAVGWLGIRRRLTTAQ